MFAGGWFRTGDLGRPGRPATCTWSDRMQEIIRSGGTNVYPAEIERVLIEHPSVREVAVIAVPDQQFGEVALAVVVPEDGAAVTLDDLVSTPGTGSPATSARATSCSPASCQATPPTRSSGTCCGHATPGSSAPPPRGRTDQTGGTHGPFGERF